MIILYSNFHLGKILFRKSLHSILKSLYLHSLCQKIEDNVELTLEIVYELIRHACNQRINANDITHLIQEWNFQ